MAAESVDTWPGSVVLTTLDPGTPAWVEARITGPAVLSWQSKIITQAAAETITVSGTPVEPLDAPPLPSSAWKLRHLLIPAGEQTVRLSYSLPGGVANPVRLDAMWVYTAARTSQTEALGDLAGGGLFDFFPDLLAVVAAAPRPGMALLVSHEHPPLVQPGPSAGTRLARCFVRPSEASFVAVAVLENRLFPSGSSQSFSVSPDSPREWRPQLALLPPGPSLLTWKLPAQQRMEITGFTADTVAVDLPAWLARSSLTWSVPLPLSAIARVWNPDAAPAGDALFLTADAAGTPLRANAEGAGWLTLTTVSELEFLGWPEVRVDGAIPFAETLGRLRRIPVGAGPHALSLSAGAAGTAALTSLQWTPAGNADPVSAVMAAALGAPALPFQLTPAAAGRVEAVAGDPGRESVLLLTPGADPTALSLDLTGPGTLTFEWRGPPLAGQQGQFLDNGLPAARTVTVIENGRTPQWSLVHWPLSPGAHHLEWRFSQPTDAVAELVLDNFTWDPRPEATPPPDAPVFTRAGGAVFSYADSAGVSITAAGWTGAAGEAAVQTTLTGPGLFTAEVRVLMSPSIPHFLQATPLPAAGVFLDNAAEHSTIPAGPGWRPLVVEIPAGPHTLRFQALRGVYPLTWEIRHASLAPAQPPASLHLPGLEWSVSPQGHVSGRALQMSGAVETAWSMGDYTVGYELATLSAALTGPGTLTWRILHDFTTTTVTADGTTRSTDSYDSASTPWHQLPVPAGLTTVAWEHGFEGTLPWPAQSLLVRWEPAPVPPLAAAAGLPASQRPWFRSEGGWEAPAWNLTQPLLRLRTRAPGRAGIFCDPDLSRSGTRQFWATPFHVWTNTPPPPEFTTLTGPITALRWDFQAGELGTLIWPVPEILTGQIDSSAPLVGETFPVWAARLGIPADPLSDPDEDGLPALTEFAQGLHPLAPETGSLILTSSAAGIRVRLAWSPVAPAGIIRTVETSADLLTWTALTVSPDATGTATAVLPPAARYVRLRVVLEQAADNGAPASGP